MKISFEWRIIFLSNWIKVECVDIQCRPKLLRISILSPSACHIITMLPCWLVISGSKWSVYHVSCIDWWLNESSASLWKARYTKTISRSRSSCFTLLLRVGRSWDKFFWGHSSGLSVTFRPTLFYAGIVTCSLISVIMRKWDFIKIVVDRFFKHWVVTFHRFIFYRNL